MEYPGKIITESLFGSKGRRKSFAWLIDPDKWTSIQAEEQMRRADQLGIDFIFIGGSLIFNHIDSFLSGLKPLTRIPLILFPGSPLQVSPRADAILLLSLISGRNAEYLIGNHVIAAPFLRESKLEILPTGYILVNGGQQTSVSYMSNTQPIPPNKPDIALATAMAGEMLGLKFIYLDAGSGAEKPVPPSMIRCVASGVSIPIIVGGGIKTPSQVEDAYRAGADLVVVGNAAEKDTGILESLLSVRDRLNTELENTQGRL